MLSLHVLLCCCGRGCALESPCRSSSSDVALQFVLCSVLCVGFGGLCFGGVRCALVLLCCSSFTVVFWLLVSRRIVCVCVLTSSCFVMVADVRSYRCFAVHFLLCVRSLFWFVLCSVCLSGESVCLCVLFFCGR